MNNTNRLLNNNKPPNETTYPQVIFSFEGKDYTIAEFLTVFTADLLDLIFLHNIIPPESTCAAIRVSVPSLNLLIIVIPFFTDYKIYHCDNCPTLGQRLSSQLRPLVSNQTLTQVLPPPQNRLVAHKLRQLDNQHPKSHHLNSLIKTTNTRNRGTPIICHYYYQIYR